MGKNAIRTFFKQLFKNRLKRGAQAIFKLYGILFPLQGPIFVIGLNRSGTSVFTRLMSESSEIVNWSEANEMWDPVGFPWEADKIPRPFWAIDPQGYINSTFAAVRPSYFKSIPGMCAMFLVVHKGINGDARFLNKSPMNTLRVDLVHSLFPDACFISLTRDPRAVVRSWIEKIRPKLEKHPRSGVETIGEDFQIFKVDGVKYKRHEMIKLLSESYCYIVKRQMEQLEKIPDEQKYYTSYEDFVRNMHRVLREIDRKFGLNSEKRIWSQIPKTLENRNIKFKNELSILEIDTIVSRCKKMMEQLNYEI